jgi:UDP-N-acetylmuramyl pentapeptide phosphotransferase/UDP-N-acetylglucosamine-1-phosphate transferase
LATWYGENQEVVEAVQEEFAPGLLVLGSVAAVAFCLSFAICILLRPWLVRYALAHPNARSSHRQPTPQGGGVAVVVATLGATWAALSLLPIHTHHSLGMLTTLTGATLLLAVVGAIDDIRSLGPGPRLIIQAIAVGILLLVLPQDIRLFPQLPRWIECLVLFIAVLWFVNLVNFMDGIDWMTVAEFVPIAAALSFIAAASILDPLSALVSFALLGAIAGFAPFNKPVARLFLGDVGSLPAGLLLGWLLLQLAGSGHLIPALILPLYYLADATFTLARRIARREPFWQPHRTHFYQRALDNGFTVPEVITRVLAANMALGALAVISVFAPKLAVPALLLAGALVAWLLLAFARPR